MNVSILKITEKPVSQGKYNPMPPIDSAVYPIIIRLNLIFFSTNVGTILLRN